MTTMVWMESITKTYQLGEIDVPVLQGIDLAIEAGEYLAIMGVSGSGKSTLMNILGCLDRPSSGHCVFEGHNLTTFSDDELAYVRNQRIGFVFQQFNLLSRTTALENVMLPMVYANVPKVKRRQRATEVLTRVGLGEKLHHRPNQLSGGQQQRVAIARALVNRPALVLADEPTGNLDPVNTYEIVQILKKINDLGTTVILTTHNQGVIDHLGQRVIVMANGKVIKDEQKKQNSKK